MSQVLPILLGGGALAVALKGEQAGAGQLSTGERGSRVDPPASAPTAIDALRARVSVASVQVGAEGLRDGQLVEDRTALYNGDIPRELADRAKARMLEEYEKLGDKGKQAVCAELKRQFPGDAQVMQLDCSKIHDFETLAELGGALVGASAGSALCGAPCGMLGSALGSYLGREVGDWIDDAWDDVGDKLEEGFDEVLDWIGF